MQVSPVRAWVLALGISGHSSAVERLLAKEKVTSSNLVARSIKPTGSSSLSVTFSGDVAERLGRGLQNLVHRFESGRRLLYKTFARLAKVFL